MILYSDTDSLVVSVAFEFLSDGSIVAYEYKDSKRRSYKDCVRFGRRRDFVFLQTFITCYVTAYGKVVISDVD